MTKVHANHSWQQVFLSTPDGAKPSQIRVCSPYCSFDLRVVEAKTPAAVRELRAKSFALSSVVREFPAPCSRPSQLQSANRCYCPMSISKGSISWSTYMSGSGLSSLSHVKQSSDLGISLVWIFGQQVFFDISFQRN